MTTIRDIFQTYGPEYLNHFGDSMPGEHLKVIDAIINCRTKHYGLMIYSCEKCGQNHTIYRSCGNRHCPTCQHHKAGQWLDNQMQRQLPGPHFMITFTVPEQLRSFMRSNQRLGYGALFKASSQTLKKLSADEKHIGGDLPGFFGVLHTWGRQLQYHPHIHYVVPGGAILKADGSWHCSRIDFFLPVKVMSKIFKAKFRDEMKKTELFQTIPSAVWTQEWNVNCQAVGSSQRSIKYLAPYVFKVAISDHRIVDVQDRNVFFRYKKKDSQRWRTMNLDVMEFLRRFLQHVLPTGFMKVRYYGFLSPACSVALEKVSTLIELAWEFEVAVDKPEKRPAPAITCPHCGGVLTYMYSVLPFMLAPEGFG